MEVGLPWSTSDGFTQGMRKQIVRLVNTFASVALAAESVVAPISVQPAAVATPEPAAICYEDQPCWDCRHMGNLTCGEGAVLPDGSTALAGWYGDPDCWPGAIWCPDTDGPYDPAVVHPGMVKAHTWVDAGDQVVDLGPSWLGWN